MLAPVVVESEARGVPYEAVAGGVDAAELEPLKKSTIEPLTREKGRSVSLVAELPACIGSTHT